MFLRRCHSFPQPGQSGLSRREVDSVGAFLDDTGNPRVDLQIECSADSPERTERAEDRCQARSPQQKLSNDHGPSAPCPVPSVSLITSKREKLNT